MTTRQEYHRQQADAAERLAASAKSRLERAKKFFTVPKSQKPLSLDVPLEDEIASIRSTVERLENGDQND